MTENEVCFKVAECEQAKSGFCCYCENFAYEKLRKNLAKLMKEADSKSEELDFSDFKQYFDEGFSPAVWEIMI